MDETRMQLLQGMPIFGAINADTLQFLLGICPTVSVPAAAYFFREREPGDTMFVLEIGNVVVLKSWGGQEHPLQTLQAGDCFGEMAMMDRSPRSASVRAVDDCTAIRISSADLYKVYARDLKQFALIQMNMGREVCRRLRDADERLFSARMGARGPVAGHVFLAD